MKADVRSGVEYSAVAEGKILDGSSRNKPKERRVWIGWSREVESLSVIQREGRSEGRNEIICAREIRTERARAVCEMDAYGPAGVPVPQDRSGINGADGKISSRERDIRDGQRGAEARPCGIRKGAEEGQEALLDSRNRLAGSNETAPVEIEGTLRPQRGPRDDNEPDGPNKLHESGFESHDVRILHHRQPRSKGPKANNPSARGSRIGWSENRNREKSLVF